MAELNFGILDTQAPGRIAAMPQQREEQQAKNAMQLMQVQQAMGQNELAKYQLSSARRTDEETNKLRALYGEASDISDPNFIRKVYAINPEKGIALDKAIAERTAKKLTQTKTEGEIQAQKYKFFVDRLSSLSQDPSDAGIDRFLKEAVDGGVMSFDLASAKSAQLKGMGLPERQKAILSAGQSAKEALAALKPDIKEFSGGMYDVSKVDPNTGMPRFLSPRVALPSTDAALRSAYAAGMKWNPETLQFENVGGGVPAQPGAAPAPVPRAAAPAQAGAPVTPATFPRDTAVQQTTRMTDATAIKRQELANEQIKLANATQKLASPAAAKDPDIRKFYEDQAKQATNNIASLNQELGGKTNNMPGAAAAAAAPVVNALIERSPKDQRDAKVVASTTTDSAGNIRRFNKFGEQIGEVLKGAGKPSATYERTQQLQKQLTQDLALTIRELENAVKPKGLIEQSTGSGAGALVDTSRAFFGDATEGAIAVATLKPIYDRVLKLVPRFEGPQSNNDTKSYENAAGQLANPAVPNKTKLAAGKEILRIMKERQAQFISRDMVELPNVPADSAAPPTAPVDMPSAAAAELARRAAAKR